MKLELSIVLVAVAVAIFADAAIILIFSVLPMEINSFLDVPIVAAPFFLIAFWVLFSFFFSWFFILNVEDHGKLTRYQFVKVTGAGAIASIATPFSGAFRYDEITGPVVDYNNIDPMLTLGLFFLCVWAALQFNDKHWRFVTWKNPKP